MKTITATSMTAEVLTNSTNNQIEIRINTTLLRPHLLKTTTTILAETCLPLTTTMMRTFPSTNNIINKIKKTCRITKITMCRVEVTNLDRITIIVLNTRMTEIQMPSTSRQKNLTMITKGIKSSNKAICLN